MFANPEIRRLALARLISSSGTEAAFFIGLWGRAAFEFESGPVGLAIMSALIGIGSIVGGLVGGLAVDRTDARRVVIRSEIVFVPATLALALAPNMTVLLLLGLVSWATGSAYETALVSMPPRLVDDDELESANARLESANWLALIAGPAIGALLAGAFDLRAIFVFDAVTSLVALGLLRGLTLRPKRPHDAEDPSPASRSGVPTTPPEAADAADLARLGNLDELRAGIRHALERPRVRLMLFLGGLTWLAFGSFVALEPLFFRDVLMQDVTALGWVNAIFGAGLFTGSVLLERTNGRFTGARAAVVLAVLSGLGSAVYVGTSSLVVVAVGALAWSIPLGAGLPMNRTLVQRDTEPEFVGRVMGAMGTLQSLSGILPVIFAPALAIAFGVQPVLLGSGLVIVALAPFGWRRAVALDAATVTSSAGEEPGDGSRSEE